MTEIAKKTPGRPARQPVQPAAPQIDEATLRAQIAAEMRAEVEATIRAEIAAKEEQERQVREATNDSRPITSHDVDGDPSVEGSVTIHFVEDGHTALGKVWVRGETLTLTPGTPNWEQSMVNIYKGSTETIMFAKMDEDQQIRKWGKRIFRPGPWPGANFDSINDPDLTDAERDQLRRAARIHEERYGPVAAR